MLMVTSIIIIASIFCQFELENFMTSNYTRDKSPFFTAFYFTMVTITTVGYGNITPQTIPGHICVVIAAMWGVILVSFVVTVVSNMFNLNENEQDAINRVDHARFAAKAISKSFKYFQNKKQFFLQI